MLCRIFSALVVVVCLSSLSEANPFKNTPLDSSTWDPVDWVKRPGDPGSSLQVVTPPTIDANGNVYSGTGSGGGRGQYVGKASIKYVGSQAYYYSNYSNIYGRPSDRRAPRHDKLQFDTTTTSRTQINPNNGEVRRYVYRGGQLQSNSLVGRASLRYEHGNWGRAYYVYGNQSVWANLPAQPQPFVNQGGFPQPQGGFPNTQGGFPNQQMNDPGANIANGILQIIGGAMQSGR